MQQFNMSSWKKYKLGELGKVMTGKTPSSKFPQHFGDYIPFITPSDFGGYNKSASSAERYISKDGAAAHQNKILPENSVLVTCIGSDMGKVVVNKKSCLTNQQINSIIPDKEIIDYNFLYYSIINQYDLLRSIASDGTTMPIINKTDFENIEINAPENLATQTRIASILSALDDKIELNRRTNHTLEQMAQILFKKYFVTDIDPDNLPEGWRWGKLGEIFTQSKETINPGNYIDKYFNHYSIPAFDVSKRPSIEIGSSILSNKSIVKSHSILFSKLNPRFPRVWPIGEVDKSTAICSTEFLVFQPKNEKFYSYTYFKLLDEELKSDLVNKATGTSGSHQRIRPNDILELEEIIPSEKSLIEFDKLVRPLINKTIEHLDENLSLIKIRDSLLPKLMSGEITVN